ncbi:hypothetical protein F4821DRAFT_167383 [Hypoxylon rubiginosum]|uniref:Uncharacterized protein n=1 Tax=Hypoxylon rubiginosum TaxID=110542 RepID=A0ACC0CW87_9PEZI|nr:hypothetical protein F4821DRAFT_167383 [Hypoxylon rubiginosum]
MAFPRTSTLSEVQLAQELNPFPFIIIGSGMGGGTLARRLIQKGHRVLLIEKGGLEYSTHVLNTSRPHFDHESKDVSTPARDNEVVFQQARKPWAVKQGSTPSEIGGGAINALGGRSLMWSLETPEINLKSTPAEMSFPDSVIKYLTEEDGYEKALRLMANSPPSDPLYPNAQIQTASEDSPDRISVQDAQTRLKNALDRYCGDHDPPFLIMNGAEYSTKEDLYYFPQGAYSTADYLLDRLHAKDEKLTVLANHEVTSFTTEPAASPKYKFNVRNIILRSTDGHSGTYELPAQGAAVILCAGTVDSAAIALRSGLNKLQIKPDRPHSTSTSPPPSPSPSGPSSGHSSIPPPQDPSDPSSELLLRFHDLYPGRLIGRGLTDHEIWSTRFWNPDQESKLPVELSTRNINVHGHNSLLTICTQAESFYLHGFATGDANAPAKKGNTLNVMLEFETKLDEASSVTIDPLTSEPLLDLHRKRLDASKEFQDALGSLARSLYDSFDMPQDEEPPQPVLAKFGFVAHEVGTMRMGEKPQNSVVDKDLKVHFMNNLFVCDLSMFPYSPMANPSLTLAALAIRLADNLPSLIARPGPKWPHKVPAQRPPQDVAQYVH